MNFSLSLDNASRILTALLSGHPSAIIIAALSAFLLPLALHFYLFRASRRKGLPTFLLLGPVAAGKTKLVKRLEQKSTHLSSSPSPSSSTPQPPKTHTTQHATLTTVQLSQSIPLGSQFYRSKHDTTRLDEIHEYRLYDTPGHGKLRTDIALTTLAELSLTGKEPVKLVSHVRDKVRARQRKDRIPLRGVVFMVDAARLGVAAEGLDARDAITTDSPLRDAAGYLHDVLCIVQARTYSGGKVDRRVDPLPVLVAVNKQDLFTALPPETVRRKLEAEIELVRQSRLRAAAAGLGVIEGKGAVTGGGGLGGAGGNIGSSSGLNEKGVANSDPYDDDDDEVDEVLGGDEEEPFSFEMLRENTGVQVTVIGGAVIDEEGEGGGEGEDGFDGNWPSSYEGIEKWERWIGQCL